MTTAVTPSLHPNNHYPTIKGMFTAAVDPASMATGAGSNLSVSIPSTCKADVGDIVLVGPGIDLQGLGYSAYIKDSTHITVVFRNDTGGTLDIASSTWTFLIVPQETGKFVA